MALSKEELKVWLPQWEREIAEAEGKKIKTQYYISHGDKWVKVSSKKCREEIRFGSVFLRYEIGQEIGMAKPGNWKVETR